MPQPIKKINRTLESQDAIISTLFVGVTEHSLVKETIHIAQFVFLIAEEVGVTIELVFNKTSPLVESYPFTAGVAQVLWLRNWTRGQLYELLDMMDHSLKCIGKAHMWRLTPPYLVLLSGCSIRHLLK